MATGYACKSDSCGRIDFSPYNFNTNYPPQGSYDISLVPEGWFVVLKKKAEGVYIEPKHFCTPSCMDAFAGQVMDGLYV